MAYLKSTLERSRSYSSMGWRIRGTAAAGWAPSPLPVSVLLSLLICGVFLHPASAACPPLRVPKAGCPSPMVNLPFSIDYSTPIASSPVTDAVGAATGFTFVDTTTKGLYKPSLLRVVNAASSLFLTATPGTAFKEQNAQDNRLGVGIPPPRAPVTISVKIVSAVIGNQGQQAGIWFGGDQDNYIRLVFQNQAQGPLISLYSEQTGAGFKSASIFAPAPYNEFLEMTLTADPQTQTASATVRGYSNGVPLAVLNVGKIPAPGTVFSFDAATVDPRTGTNTFAGIYASSVVSTGPTAIFQFLKFSVRGAASAKPPPGVATGGLQFKRVDNQVAYSPTSMDWGPDGKLYVVDYYGVVHALSFDSNFRISADVRFNNLKGRLALGLAVDPASTAQNVMVWVSTTLGGGGSKDTGVPNSGKITRLWGKNFVRAVDYVTGLPRSQYNHALNSVRFHPDGRLCFSVGSNTEAGGANTYTAPSGNFGTRPEQVTSAGLFCANVKDPKWKASTHGDCASPFIENLGLASTSWPKNCKVTRYATGLRNMYDFVYHSKFKAFYGPDNGMGLPGEVPIIKAGGQCQGVSKYILPKDPQDPGTQSDMFHRIIPGKYYGHANPARSECVFNNGSFQGLPTPKNFVQSQYTGLHWSCNGIIEYKADRFCGQLKGDLLTACYSLPQDVKRVKLSSNGLKATFSTLVGGLADPLSIATDKLGNIYVGLFNNAGRYKKGFITVLAPKDQQMKCPRRFL